MIVILSIEMSSLNHGVQNFGYVIYHGYAMRLHPPLPDSKLLVPSKESPDALYFFLIFQRKYSFPICPQVGYNVART